MTRLSDLFSGPPYYNTCDATIVQADLVQGVVAYGVTGMLGGSVVWADVQLLLHMNGADL